MEEFRVQAVYDANGSIDNYCVYKSDFNCVYETLSFTNYLKNVRGRSLHTIQNKAASLRYWYQYLDDIEQDVDAFFTLQEQLDFINILKTKKNYRRKKKVYIEGTDPYETGLKAETIRLHISNINEYYEYLCSHGSFNLSKNHLPFRKELGITIATENHGITLPEVLSIDEVNRMISACNTYRDKAIIITLLSTGMRLGELCTLTVQALDFKNHTVHLRHQYLDLSAGVLKTGERELKGSQVMFNAIQKYLIFERSKVADCDNLFVTLSKRNNPAGSPLKEDSIKQVFTRLREKTKIPNCHAHILRHTFATLFLASKTKSDKVTVAVLQKLMGHKNINTTMIYTHLDYTLDDFKENQEFENKLNNLIQLP